MSNGRGAKPWLSAMLATLPGVRHTVTQRVIGMGRADGNVGYSAPRDRHDAWAMRQEWCALSGLDANRLITLGQVHGAVVHVAAPHQAGSGAQPGATQIGLGDALVSDSVGPVLMTLHADCQPLLFVDPARNGHGPVVAVAHAGWRGTVADVAGETIRAMSASCGTRAEDVHVALGPAIGSCCYEVGEDVVTAWQAVAGTDAGVALNRVGEQYFFSLVAANRLLLDRAGVRADHLEATALCTRCEGNSWFSHRGQGAATGRFGALISIDPIARR